MKKDYINDQSRKWSVLEVQTLGTKVDMLKYINNKESYVQDPFRVVRPFIKQIKEMFCKAEFLGIPMNETDPDVLEIYKSILDLEISDIVMEQDNTQAKLFSNQIIDSEIKFHVPKKTRQTPGSNVHYSKIKFAYTMVLLYNILRQLENNNRNVYIVTKSCEDSRLLYLALKQFKFAKETHLGIGSIVKGIEEIKYSNNVENAFVENILIGDKQDLYINKVLNNNFNYSDIIISTSDINNTIVVDSGLSYFIKSIKKEKYMNSFTLKFNTNDYRVVTKIRQITDVLANAVNVEKTQIVREASDFDNYNNIDVFSPCILVYHVDKLVFEPATKRPKEVTSNKEKPKQNEEIVNILSSLVNNLNDLIKVLNK